SPRPHVTTCAPSPARSSAVARPIPPVDPVTRQTRSPKPMSTAENYNDTVTTILLARHGETDWNREGRFQGHADPPLNGTGRAQAAQLAAGRADVELSAVYSSPLRRALETARVVAAAHELEAVALDAL